MGIPVVVVDCAGLSGPELGRIDALARLQLLVNRCGCQIRLANVDAGLAELIAFAGLAGVLSVEPAGEAEKRKELGGLEEEREL